MTGPERSIKGMNFEATDRLPIMMNGVSAPFVQWLLGISEDDYWANQRAYHFETMRRLGQDFHIQLWFPPRERKNWSVGQETQWGDDVDAIVAEMERDTAALLEQAQAIKANRETHIREIMDYQVNVQAELGDQILWIFGMDSHGAAICHLSYGKFGYEGLFITIATNPDVVGSLIGAQGIRSCAHNECVVEAANRLAWPKICYCGTDMTTQRGNMVDPKTMDKIYFPHLDHALRPLVDNGFKIIWHSDGNMNDMLHPLIDIGVAGFQGFQEECGTLISDVAKLSNRNGDVIPRIGIGYAVSNDGINWEKPVDGLLISPRGFDTEPYEYISSKPCVLKEDGGYRMWVHTFGYAYRVRSLTSPDGLNWEWVPSGPDGEFGVGESGEFDDIQRCYACVVKHGEEYRCWYTGNQYGQAGMGYAVGKTGC
ncbi:MAG: hypothetical protein Q7N50_14440 [Armatimonadota bacterium]|nr:hypothetical protein [Armatimonadota bacterium]